MRLPSGACVCEGAYSEKRSKPKSAAFQRREWDLNPRMTVLQTVALGHLAIPPMWWLRGRVYTRNPRESRENYAKVDFFCKACEKDRFLRK